MVGFDPRYVSSTLRAPASFDHSAASSSGVGRTTPVLNGFTSTEEFLTFSIKFEEGPPLGATPDAVARTYARFASYGAVAQTRLKDIGPYVNTPFVARDMLAMTTAAGFHKLKYWGISYGTLLGQSGLLPDDRSLTSSRADIRIDVPPERRAHRRGRRSGWP
jgi:hypothetical protein